MKTFLALAAVVATCLTVSGCSSPKTGTASPADSPSATASGSNIPAHGAPTVANPLGAEKYLQNPCGLMTTAQTAELGGMTAPEEDLRGVAGPQCKWRDPSEKINNLTIAFLVAGAGGLSGAYAAHEQGGTAYFEPTEISGYPAVYIDQIDARKQGTCSLTVGIRDDLAMSIIASFQTTSPNYSNPCPIAAKAAEFAVATLKAGQ